MTINWATVATTIIGGLLAATVIYQVKKHTTGIIDDD